MRYPGLGRLLGSGQLRDKATRGHATKARIGPTSGPLCSMLDVMHRYTRQIYIQPHPAERGQCCLATVTVIPTGQ